MKKNKFILFLVLFLNINMPQIFGYDVTELEYSSLIIKSVINSYHETLEWYTAHAAVAKTIAFLGITYFLYKRYCPVANRCKKCLENSQI
ncbi:MAG: hypothetical protein K2X90_02970 [Candidatus Babeliaceae bacterium]|nr:hypothetical protein [Candidatus Babeliaceae bacterium]